MAGICFPDPNMRFPYRERIDVGQTDRKTNNLRVRPVSSEPVSVAGRRENGQKGSQAGGAQLPPMAPGACRSPLAPIPPRTAMRTAAAPILPQMIWDGQESAVKTKRTSREASVKWLAHASASPTLKSRPVCSIGVGPSTPRG